MNPIHVIQSYSRENQKEQLFQSNVTPTELCSMSNDSDARFEVGHFVNSHMFWLLLYAEQPPLGSHWYMELVSASDRCPAPP